MCSYCMIKVGILLSGTMQDNELCWKYYDASEDYTFRHNGHTH